MPPPYRPAGKGSYNSHNLASPGIEAQIRHQLNDERRVISSQAPPLVSFTANESAGLLVAPLISGPSQEAISITAKKLVAGTSTTSAERTPKIGVTFRTDEPTTYSQRERQHRQFRRRQKATTYSRTRNIYHPYDHRRSISSQPLLSYGNNPRQVLKTFKPRCGESVQSTLFSIFFFLPLYAIKPLSPSPNPLWERLGKQ